MRVAGIKAAKAQHPVPDKTKTTGPRRGARRKMGIFPNQKTLRTSVRTPQSAARAALGTPTNANAHGDDAYGGGTQGMGGRRSFSIGSGRWGGSSGRMDVVAEQVNHGLRPPRVLRAVLNSQLPAYCFGVSAS